MYDGAIQYVVATYHFTGKERDSESGLDNFGARYYSSNLGRFMSADEPFADQNPADPQSWNLYHHHFGSGRLRQTGGTGSPYPLGPILAYRSGIYFVALM